MSSTNSQPALKDVLLRMKKEVQLNRASSLYEIGELIAYGLHILKENALATEGQAAPPQPCAGCLNDDDEWVAHIDECIAARVAAKEASRWQKIIYQFLRQNAPQKDRIDGSGCDTGDPLDLTLTEIEQLIDQLKDVAASQAATRDEPVERVPVPPPNGLVGIVTRAMENAEEDARHYDSNELGYFLQKDDGDAINKYLDELEAAALSLPASATPQPVTEEMLSAGYGYIDAHTAHTRHDWGSLSPRRIYEAMTEARGKSKAEAKDIGIRFVFEGRAESAPLLKDGDTRHPNEIAPSGAFPICERCGKTVSTDWEIHDEKSSIQSEDTPLPQPFSELREKMSPESRERSEKLADEYRASVPQPPRLEVELGDDGNWHVVVKPDPLFGRPIWLSVNATEETAQDSLISIRHALAKPRNIQAEAEEIVSAITVVGHHFTKDGKCLAWCTRCPMVKRVSDILAKGGK
jgi:hypothetical protein